LKESAQPDQLLKESA